MKFKLSVTTENFDVLRFVSAEGNWEFGMTRMILGTRVRFGRVGSDWVNIDYCAGADPVFQLELLDAVGIILSQFPETVTGGSIESFFPGYEVRPINNDACWEKLQAMRDAIAPIGSFVNETMKLNVAEAV